MPEFSCTRQQTLDYFREQCRRAVARFGRSGARRRRTGFCNELQQLESRELLTSAVDLVLDTNVIPRMALYDPRNFLNAADVNYFSATTDWGGEELWRTESDGSGIRNVADIWPGQNSSLPQPSNCDDFLKH